MVPWATRCEPIIRDFLCILRMCKSFYDAKESRKFRWGTSGGEEEITKVDKIAQNCVLQMRLSLGNDVVTKSKVNFTYFILCLISFYAGTVCMNRPEADLVYVVSLKQHLPQQTEEQRRWPLHRKVCYDVILIGHRLPLSVFLFYVFLQVETRLLGHIVLFEESLQGNNMVVYFPENETRLLNSFYL